MNALQRLAVRVTARIAPPLANALRQSGGTVDRLSEQLALYRSLADDRQVQNYRIRAELEEACAMANGGPWLRGSSGEVARESGAVLPLKERLAELELALEDRGWKRQLAIAESEFSRYGIQQIILISRLYFIKNPLIRRGVKVSAMYVFGRGVEISSENTAANKTLEAFLDDPQNKKELGHSALVAKEESLHTDGNLFLAFFTDPSLGTVQIRSIDPLEIQDVVTDPDDVASPWFYKRQWMSQEFDPLTGLTMPRAQNAWYVDIDHTPAPGMQVIQNNPLMRDGSGQLIPILHQKVGALPKWHFGCPLVYSALDWARAYKHFLEDWATITRALARFAWSVETQGGAPAIAAFKQTLATTLGIDGTSIETNPPPVTGSTFISGPGNKLTPMKTQGATTEPEQGRRVMLMVAAAFGLPETFFGDSSTGSLATAQSLDRPTELQFLMHQERWRELLQRVCKYVLDRSGSTPNGKLKEAGKQAKDIPVDIKFPSVLEHDITTRIAAISNAMTLDGYPVTGIDEKIGVGLLLQELGVEDVQTVLDAMYPDSEYDPDRTAEEEEPPTPPALPPGTPAPANAPPAGSPPPAPQPKPKTKTKTASESQIAGAVIELRKAVAKLQERKSAS